MRNNCRRSRRMGNNRRSLPRGGNNLARLRTRRRNWRGRLFWRCHRCRSLGNNSNRRFYWQMASPGLFFLFLLLRQNGLQGIAGLGYVRQINFRRDCLPLR